MKPNPYIFVRVDWIPDKKQWKLSEEFDVTGISGHTDESAYIIFGLGMMLLGIDMACGELDVVNGSNHGTVKQKVLDTMALVREHFVTAIKH